MYPLSVSLTEKIFNVDVFFKIRKKNRSSMHEKENETDKLKNETPAEAMRIHVRIYASCGSVLTVTCTRSVGWRVQPRVPVHVKTFFFGIESH